MGILLPRFGGQHGLLLGPVVLVDLLAGVDLHDVVAHLPRLLGDRALRGGRGHLDVANRNFVKLK